MSGAAAQGVLGLVPTHQWLDLDPRVSGAAGAAVASARKLVCGARSCALLWTWPGPRTAVGSGGLKTDCLLVCGAVFSFIPMNWRT